MYEYEHREGGAGAIIPPDIFERRSGTERRHEPACGFACISTVGWICRREKFRRKEDRDVLFNKRQ